jgi:hypothetical protein
VDDLTGLGIDSITVMELVNQISKKFDVELMPTVLFSRKSFSSLVEYMLEEYRERLIEMYKLNANQVSETDNQNHVNQPSKGESDTQDFWSNDNEGVIHDLEQELVQLRLIPV